MVYAYGGKSDRKKADFVLLKAGERTVKLVNGEGIEITRLTVKDEMYPEEVYQSFRNFVGKKVMLITEEAKEVANAVHENRHIAGMLGCRKRPGRVAPTPRC